MGLFGRKTTTTPVAAPPPEQKTGCCHHVSRALCSGIITTILFCIFGLSICALVGRRYYWYYYTANSSDQGAFWISGGWLDFEDRDLGYHSLKDANFGLWIIGIISAAALLASAFIAFFEFFVSITNNAGRHTAGLSFPMGIILVGILICYIAAAAIEMDKWSNANLGTRYRVWPSWGWICAIVAGVLWWFVGSFAACIGPKYGKAKYTQSTAQGYPAEHHYPSSAAAGAAGAGAGAGAGAAAGKPKRGLFGRNKNAAAAPGTPQQSYAAQPFNADQGPNAGANRDVEMGNAGVPHNDHHGHTGEALAAGGGVGAGAAAAAHHHNQRQANQAAAPQKEKRTMFGRKRTITPAADGAGNTAGDQPTYANQPQGGNYANQAPTQGNYPNQPQPQGAFTQSQQGVAPTGGDQPRGAWAGSRLSDQEAQRGNGDWAGQGQAPGGAATGPGTGAGAPAAQPAAQATRADSGVGKKKSGIFSFYH